MPELSKFKPTPQRYKEAARVLLQCRRPLLVTHERSDGDALGCLLGLHAILEAQGLTARAIVFEDCPRQYRFLPRTEALTLCKGSDDPLLEQADGVVIMDTCTYSQLEPVRAWLCATQVPKIVLDHHRTVDELADVYLIDADAAAASLLVVEWARALNWRIPADAAQAFFVGIATDTGWFRFNNTTPAALRTAADMLEAGADVDLSHARLYLSDPVSAFRLRSWALAGTELLLDDRLALIPVTAEMFSDTGAVMGDTENLVNGPLSIACVRVAVTLIDMGDGMVKCSFRSKSAIDVARLAQRFGGGGHSRAAGARIAGTIDSVRCQIIEAVELIEELDR